MNVSNAKDLLKSFVTKGVNVSLLFVGPMGVGKSQIVKQVSEELGIGLIDLRLAQMDPGDMIGMPRVFEGKTIWAKPCWWPEEGTKGILFLDELNRAPNDVRQAVFQLVLDGHLNTHKLPEGWRIVSAINPENGQYQVEALDQAMVRRFCVIGLQPEVDTWLKWANGDGKIINDITSFISAHKKLLYLPEDYEFTVKPTPDSYRMLNTLLTHEAIPKGLEIETYAGLIGREGAVAFQTWLTNSKTRPVSGEEVLTDYDKYADKIKKQRNDEMYASVTDTVGKLKALGKALTDDQFTNYKKFIVGSSAEFRVTLIKQTPKELMARLLQDQKISQIVTDVLTGVSK
jgi:hypothetical protein